MALEKNSYVERVLIVLDARGDVVGAHQERLEQVTEAGVVLSARMLPAEPLNPAALCAALPDVAAAVAQVQALRDAMAASEAAIRAAERAVADAQTAHVGEVGALKARIAELEAKVGPVDADGFAVLSPVQVRLGLLKSGVQPSAISAAISAIQDPTERETATAFWDYSTAFHRRHPLLNALAGILGLGSAQVDEIWRTAAAIE